MILISRKEVLKTIMDRKEHPKEGSYTNYLFDKGIDKMFLELRKAQKRIAKLYKDNKNPKMLKLRRGK